MDKARDGSSGLTFAAIQPDVPSVPTRFNGQDVGRVSFGPGQGEWAIVQLEQPWSLVLSPNLAPVRVEMIAIRPLLRRRETVDGVRVRPDDDPLCVDVYAFRSGKWEGSHRFDVDRDTRFVTRADVWLATATDPTRRIAKRPFRYQWRRVKIRGSRSAR